MMNKYIKDGDKVRRCASNESKMNVFIWIYFYFKYWNGFNEVKYYSLESIKYSFLCICNILGIILFPLGFPLKAYLSIRRAKKECELLKRN